MVGAIVDDHSVMVDGAESRKPVSVFSATYESSRTGELIRFS